MADIGWIFSDDSVRGILAGRKTQTRRLIKRSNSLVDGYPVSKLLWSWLDFASPEVFVDAGPSPAGNPGPYLHVPNRESGARQRVYPRWHRGQRVWVKETWALLEGKETKRSENGGPFLPTGQWLPGGIGYRADIDECGQVPITENGHTVRRTPHGWRSSMFMPRTHARIELTITDVRAQQLLDISEDDAEAEGLWRGKARRHLFWPNASLCRLTDGQRHVDAFADLWDSLNRKHAPADTNPWVWAYTFEHSTVTRHA